MDTGYLLTFCQSHHSHPNPWGLWRLDPFQPFSHHPLSCHCYLHSSQDPPSSLLSLQSPGLAVAWVPSCAPRLELPAVSLSRVRPAIQLQLILFVSEPSSPETWVLSTSYRPWTLLYLLSSSSKSLVAMISLPPHSFQAAVSTYFPFISHSLQ